MIERFLNLLAPDKCIECGVEGAPLCAVCSEGVFIPKASTCPLCNALTDNYKLCKSCRPKAKFSTVYIASHYDGTVKQLLTELKFNNQKSIGNVLGRRLAQSLPYQGFDLVTYPPSTSRNYRRRSYNPAKLLAKAAARELSLPCYELLARHDQSNQLGKSRQQRLRQLEKNFKPRHSAVVQDKKVLVVDDILTTGGTMKECARTLKQADARKIHGAVVAKH